MKEYRVISSQRTRAEQIMNEMARQGWELHSVTYWTKWGVCLVLTFQREIPQTVYRPAAPTEPPVRL